MNVIEAGMLLRVHSLRKDSRGATSTEYGIIAAFISCGIVATLSALGGNLGTIFSEVANGLGGGASNITAPPPNNTNHFNG